jgi:hypothetical protein
MNSLVKDSRNTEFYLTFIRAVPSLLDELEARIRDTSKDRCVLDHKWANKVTVRVGERLDLPVKCRQAILNEFTPYALFLSIQTWRALDAEGQLDWTYIRTGEWE